MYLVFDFVVLRFGFDCIMFVCLFIYLFIYLLIYLFIYFGIYTYVACLKFVMLFLVKLNQAKDFRLELFFI